MMSFFNSIRTWVTSSDLGAPALLSTCSVATGNWLSSNKVSTMSRIVISVFKVGGVFYNSLMGRVIVYLARPDKKRIDVVLKDNQGRETRKLTIILSESSRDRFKKIVMGTFCAGVTVGIIAAEPLYATRQQDLDGEWLKHFGVSVIFDMLSLLQGALRTERTLEERA